MSIHLIRPPTTLYFCKYLFPPSGFLYVLAILDSLQKVNEIIEYNNVFIIKNTGGVDM